MVSRCDIEWGSSSCISVCHTTKLMYSCLPRHDRVLHSTLSDNRNETLSTFLWWYSLDNTSVTSAEAGNIGIFHFRDALLRLLKLSLWHGVFNTRKLWKSLIISSWILSWVHGLLKSVICTWQVVLQFLRITKHRTNRFALAHIKKLKKKRKK